MGIVTNLFIFGFFIIALVIGFSTFSPLFTGLIDEASGFFVDTQLKPEPESNEAICDLRVKVFADLDQTLAFSEFFVRISPIDSHNYSWDDCHASGNFPLGSLLDLGTRFEPLAIATGEVIETACITIVDAKDPSQKVTPVTNPKLCRDITVTRGATLSLALPFNVDAEFVINNIPLREYDLEIVYQGRDIAITESGERTISLNANEPYITKICDQFSFRDRQTCVRTG
jgi:hypothetical protein